MAKRVNAGELRTRIYIRKTEKETDGEGVSGVRETSIFDDPPGRPERVYHCKWVNAYGAEAVSAMQLQIEEPATLTMRYSPLIQPDQLIYRLGDPVPYEITGVNDVEGRRCWLEVKVRRRRAAR
ncbi:MAG: head-tail adaptor protein [Oscillospiraceae bacterium]|nr:head-tail adaptor protein [Oscillospiraceae bacterium]